MTKPFDAEQARALVKPSQNGYEEFAKDFIDIKVREEFLNSKCMVVAFDAANLSREQIFVIMEELKVRGFSAKIETYRNETSLYIEA